MNIDKYFDSISKEDLLRDLIDCGLKVNMKNINGEEINKELYEKKINEKLSEISNYIDDCKEDYHYLVVDELQKLIFEYGTLHYMYGGFNALNDRIN